MPFDSVGFAYVEKGCHIAICRICGLKATHLSSTGTYMDSYLVAEDGSYNSNNNTFICWNCWRKK